MLPGSSATRGRSNHPLLKRPSIFRRHAACVLSQECNHLYSRRFHGMVYNFNTMCVYKPTHEEIVFFRGFGVKFDDGWQ
jgi:hypothetical protein